MQRGHWKHWWRDVKKETRQNTASVKQVKKLTINRLGNWRQKQKNIFFPSIMQIYGSVLNVHYQISSLYNVIINFYSFCKVFFLFFPYTQPEHFLSIEQRGRCLGLALSRQELGFWSSLLYSFTGCLLICLCLNLPVCKIGIIKPADISPGLYDT